MYLSHKQNFSKRGKESILGEKQFPLYVQNTEKLGLKLNHELTVVLQPQ